ncbi:hypothetical protein [Prosthecobacter fluviatilis]|uniref:Uncharacterized protein n=1 Tax=Prosthecobacter fluviatilis TaxID=445931 RepID=A0ABW0KNS3_9BACT
MKCILTVLLMMTACAEAEEMRYVPGWGKAVQRRTIKRAETGKDALKGAVAALQPGDRFVIAAGVYSFERMWDIGVCGTEESPIWIVAEEGVRVVLTRPDAKQNVMNMGQGRSDDEGGAADAMCEREGGSCFGKGMSLAGLSILQE